MMDDDWWSPSPYQCPYCGGTTVRQARTDAMAVDCLSCHWSRVFDAESGPDAADALEKTTNHPGRA